MPRSGPSAADAAVVARVRDYGQQISPAQLERGRRDGLLVRNLRRGRGRGVGSTSHSPDGAAEAAAAFARFSRQGQSRHMMVLHWFCHAGLPLNDEDGPPIPEPPMEPVRHAMLWYDRRALAGRLKDLAPASSEDSDLDQLYTAIHKVVGRARVPDPQLSDRMRAIVLAGEDLPGGRDRVRHIREAIVQSLAAQTAGAEQIGSDLLVDSLTAIRMLPAEYTAAVKASMRTHELAGIPVLPGIDPAYGQRRIEAATANQLQRARDLARTLLTLASFAQVLRWGAPDTVPLDAVEAAFVSHGLGMLLHAGLNITEPHSLIPATGVLLEPLFAALAQNMLDSLPPHPFGDMQAQLDGMIRNLKAATGRVG